MLSGASILLTPTVPTFSGGTSATLAALGITGNTAKFFIDDGTASPLSDRSHAEFTATAPRVNSGSPSGYTQARTKVLLKVPITLGNGSITYNTLSLTCASDIETTEAQRLEMLLNMAQITSQADFLSVFNDLSLA